MPRAKKKPDDEFAAKVFLATPMYGGHCTGVYVQSLIDMAGMFSANKVRLSCAFMFNESLITRARNNLVSQFLETDNTHLLFIDADQQWRASDIMGMLHHDKDVIVGMCPKKEINWGSVREAVKRDEADLSRFTGSFVVNLLDGTSSMVVPQSEPFEIAAGGTGIMLIKRKVFEKLKKRTPIFRNDMAHMPGGKPVHRFFTESIDPESQRLLSEDYHFCHEWRKAGGKVWAAPWCKIGHFGTYNFTGQLIETNEPTTVKKDGSKYIRR